MKATKADINEKSTEKLADKTTDKATDKATDKTTDKTTDKAADKTADKSTDKSNSFFKYLAYIWKEKKSLYLMGILFFPAFITANYLQIYLPKLVVQELEEKRPISYMGISILILVAVLMAATILRVQMRAKVEYGNKKIVKKMQIDFAGKLLNVDYRYLEDGDFLAIRNKLKKSLFGGSIGDAQRPGYLDEFMPNLIIIAAAAGNIAVYITSLWQLSPWLSLIVLVIPLSAKLVNSTLKKHEVKYAQQNADTWQKLDYVTRKTEDFTMAKDVRLYRLDKWFSGLIDRFTKEGRTYKAKEMRLEAISNIINTVVYTIFYGCFFACVLYRLWKGNIQVSDVVFFAGMGPSLYHMMSNDFMHSIIRLSKIVIEYHRFETFINYGEDSGIQSVAVVTEPSEIRLEHVSYIYPGAKNKVLNDISLTVKAGEKIAVVGVNGAGKTTLMKLICGLLHPTEGRILLNGTDMEAMRAEERYARFSCAFQDIQFLPLSIRDNISVSATGENKETDERVWACLAQAGIKEYIESLPQGIDTMMEKNINENATDFSGGQRQKLILARALYRNAGTIILDEPTAALDALAENEIYVKYALLSSNKTSFFVSHRLSSTRFCDRILLIDGGNVAEEGTHSTLLLKGGLYARMFETQSKYYKEETNQVSCGGTENEA